MRGQFEQLTLTQKGICMKSLLKCIVLLFAFVIFASVIAGCATTSQPPADVARFNFAIPALGTQTVYRITDYQGSLREETHTVVEASYEGRAVFGISDGVDLMIYSKATGNLIATLREGKKQVSISPESGTFSWPLWVGKSWLATYAYDDHVRGRNWSAIQTWWKVTAHEEIRVPAGTFKVLRLESTPGAHNAVHNTLWYSPDLKIIVRRISERTADHYLGTGKLRSELIRFKLPGN